MNRGLRGEAAIVGVAECKPARQPASPPRFQVEQWAELSRLALEDAGLSPERVWTASSPAKSPKSAFSRRLPYPSILACRSTSQNMWTSAAPPRPRWSGARLRQSSSELARSSYADCRHRLVLRHHGQFSRMPHTTARLVEGMDLHRRSSTFPTGTSFRTLPTR